MKFSCHVNEMIEALSVVTKALPSHTTNAILEDIRIEANRKEVVLTCSDERITIISRFDATVEETGAGVVRGRLFAELVRKLPQEMMTVVMNNSFSFKITSGAAVVNIAGQDADLYPTFPRIDNEQEINLPQQMLKDMITRTEFAIAAEDMREVLTGGYLEIENGVVNMVGLDSFRMAIRSARISAIDQNIKAIIPGRCITDIGKLLSDDEDDFCELSIGNGKLHIALPKTDIYVVLIAGQYVNYRRILPQSFKSTVTVRTEPFRRCLDRAALIAREGNNNLLIFRIEENTLLIEAHSDYGDVYEPLDVSLNGENISIAFNVKYILDIVRFIDTENLVFYMNSATMPCIVRPEGDNDMTHLILPVRTSQI